MLTVLLYLLIMVLVGGLLYFAASMVFGRSEELPPLPAGTTATVLPAEGVTGSDVRALRFQQTLRGYKASEVDWALDRLGREIDSLRAQLETRVGPAPADRGEAADGSDSAEPER
ncbi:DivIVA domain-containing protein [Rhodococcus sp. TAF43]|uniref:DivIVA domain-containing protein n=1 Tax=unclassified Rhodococcus (in: high G+C Gram-positive bacteria) TaxID=192944 RepID=UPI000E0C47A8|nr:MULTISPECIES: DivIVA domain-containing protein [unclassified Rhodococcus (in: high G+C Gram-positive bacteria)]QKT10783.1 DivIVA domain-containing protein [Rhodococcus sp. W8901]RDI35959.1 DivIVA domain-containing protein [Rhodococcus sp. AG1013]